MQPVMTTSLCLAVTRRHARQMHNLWGFFDSIKYFVYFVETNMPREYDTLKLMFGTHCNVSSCCKLLLTKLLLTPVARAHASCLL
jgi:hypothetical protein